jgi:AcrR family transcriptional regulator
MPLAPLVTRTLAGDLPARDHATDRRIMDAVVAELCATPLDKLAVEDVAARAGVTRMTVYRRFGDRQRLIEATFAREVNEFFAGLLAADDPGARPSDRIATAFATALTLAHTHPVVAHLLATSPGDLLENILADDGFVIAAGSDFIATHLGGDRRTGETLARLFVALVLMPPRSLDLTDPDEAGELARGAVVPIVAARAARACRPPGRDGAACPG